MDKLPPTETTTLLQRGIAAARAGRSQEARQLLQKVVESEPGNEMAWLWLSGLMATNEQKRACLERVLLANPENTYARVGLERLRVGSATGTVARETDIIEARLAAISGNGSPKPAGTGSTAQDTTLKPSTKPLVSFPSLNETEIGQSGATKAMDGLAESPQLSAQTPSDPDSFETSCPICDQSISPVTRRCPHCFTPFNLDQLLARGKPTLLPRDTQPLKPPRKGILGFLGAIIAS
jgi:hypothetical protein